MAREVDSLSVQKQLNALFEQRLSSENEILKTMQKELQVAIQLQTVLGKLSTEELAKNIDASAEAMKTLSSESKEAGDIGAKAMKSISDNVKKSEKSTLQMGSSFKGLTSVLSGVATTALGVGKSMFNIGKSILSIPFGIFKNLMSDAASFVGDTAFAQALENVRKEFGSFKEGTSKDILGAYSTMNTQLQAVSGLSVWRVFEGPADQLKYIQEMASKAGSQILQFGGEIAKSAGIIATFDKGMGIGAENMKGMMDRATIFGTTLEKQLGDVANYALQMGKDFGISSKIISREVGNMQKDVRNFGSLTVKQMTVAAVYTKKLGLEMKDLTGLVGQFDNFDKAAESAGLLSQAFGASVDAFKLMNEQDPAKRLDELRKSMNAAGKSSENMSRQELHLLASTAGLSDEAAKLAFSTKNQGLSYDEVQKQSNKAENAQMKQADALMKLADNIERVVRSGGQMQNSFFKMFVSGMERGVKTSRIYIGAMQSVRAALWETHMSGLEVGRTLASSEILGFGKFMKNFGDTFSPKTIRKIMRGTKDEAGVQGRGVVAELNDVFNGKQGVSSAVANIRKHFMAAVDPATLHGMLEGGKSMMKFVAKGLGSGLSFVVKEMTHVVQTITDFIKNPKEFLDKIKSGANGAQSFAGTLVSQFAEAFGDPSILKDLGTSLLALGKTVVAKLKKIMSNPEFQKGLLHITGPMLGTLFGKQALSLLPSILSNFGPGLLRALSATGLGGVAGAAVVGSALVNVNKKMGEFEKVIDSTSDKTSKKMGAFGASMLQGLTFGLLPDNIAQMMANKMAELTDAIFAGLKKQMGGPFVGKLKALLGSGVNFFDSVGGLIGAVMGGNSSEISKAAEKVGENLVELMTTGFDFLITEFPKIVMKLNGVLSTIGGAILTGLGDAIDKVADKLGPFGFALKTVGWTFKMLGSYATFMGEQWTKMFEFFKEFDLSELMLKQSVKVKTAALDIMKSIVGIGEPIAKIMGISLDGIKSKMDEFSKGINSDSDLLMKNAQMKAAAKNAAAFAEKQKNAGGDISKVGIGSQGEKGGSGVKSTEPSSVAQDVQLSVDALMIQKKSLEENLKGLQKFSEGTVIKTISDAIPKASSALTEFNDKLSKSSISSTLQVTEGIVASINSLNNVLGDGNSGAIKIGEKLKRYADNSGLGRNGTYEIKNKGINLKLDLRITMDAGEVEKAIVLRKDSIIFDAIEESASSTLNQQHKEQIAATRGGA